MSAGRDADKGVHAAIGKTMRIGDLAHHMIVTSSKPRHEPARRSDQGGSGGSDARAPRYSRHRAGARRRRRKAFEANFNHRVTANGLVALFRVIHERSGVCRNPRARCSTFLFQQEFRSGIPAGIPADVRAATRIANKTGEISVAAHDAGIVFLPGREPYVLAVLTEPDPNSDRRMERIARVSTVVYEWLTS